MSDVTIEIEEEQQVTAPPPVTVIDTGSADAVPAYVVDLVERVTRLEGRVDDVETAARNATYAAEDAQTSANAAADIASVSVEIADTALEVANEAAEVAVATAEETGVVEEVAEMTTGDLVEDVTPHKTHWMFRPMDEWKRDLSG